MDKELQLEQIIKYIPYEDYATLIAQYAVGKAKFIIPFKRCQKIASRENYLFSYCGHFLGFILSVIVTLVFAIFQGNYSLLWWLPIELFFPILLYLFDKIYIVTFAATGVVLILKLFAIELPIFVYMLCCCWCACDCVFSWWHKKIRYYCRKRLIFSFDNIDFMDAFNSSCLSIVDEKGNVYDYEKLCELEREEQEKLNAQHKRYLNLEKLWEIVKIALAPRDFKENINQATRLLAEIYIEEGKNISTDLYSKNHERNVALENLNAVLEIGLGVTGLENVIAAFIKAYQTKGVVFPDDIIN